MIAESNWLHPHSQFVAASFAEKRLAGLADFM